MVSKITFASVSHTHTHTFVMFAPLPHHKFFCLHALRVSATPQIYIYSIIFQIVWALYIFIYSFASANIYIAQPNTHICYIYIYTRSYRTRANFPAGDPPFWSLSLMGCEWRGGLGGGGAGVAGKVRGFLWNLSGPALRCTEYKCYTLYSARNACIISR